jgi:radical SAM superfamily enzyme
VASVVEPKSAVVVAASVVAVSAASKVRLLSSDSVELMAVFKDEKMVELVTSVQTVEEDMTAKLVAEGESVAVVHVSGSSNIIGG